MSSGGSHKPVIVVHGGAGTYNRQPRFQLNIQGVCEAARAGYKLLEAGGSAVDAVEAAAVSMEDNPVFNAGKGSYLTLDYQIEMDAAIMDGSTLRVGGVGCITNVKNPIKVARLVMDKTEHILFVGEGALRFAQSQGVEKIPLDDLLTEKSVKRLEENPKWTPALKAQIYESKQTPDDEHDTVGAVAMDCHGNLAFATTTGGITAKTVGRMGDSPVVGSGGYADNASGAVSTTGHGESLMKTCVAKHAAILMEQGESAQRALEVSLDYMLEKTRGVAGAIALDKHGSVGMYFTSEGMAWASIQDGHIHHGIYMGEDTVETYTP